MAPPRLLQQSYQGILNMPQQQPPMPPQMALASMSTLPQASMSPGMLGGGAMDQQPLGMLAQGGMLSGMLGAQQAPGLLGSLGVRPLPEDPPDLSYLGFMASSDLAHDLRRDILIGKKRIADLPHEQRIAALHLMEGGYLREPDDRPGRW